MLRYLLQLALTLVLAICIPILAIADGEKGKSIKPRGFGQLGLNFGGSQSETPWTFSGRYEVEEGGQRGRVTVQVKLDDGHHIFSTTQPAGGPSATVISLKSPGVSLAGPFAPDSHSRCLSLSPDLKACVSRSITMRLHGWHPSLFRLPSVEHLPL